jgi:hypothetical protein
MLGTKGTDVDREAGEVRAASEKASCHL